MLTRCRECFGPQIDVYFKAPVFLKFERDGNGCISANQFLNYLNLRTTMHQNVRACPLCAGTLCAWVPCTAYACLAGEHGGLVVRAGLQ